MRYGMMNRMRRHAPLVLPLLLMACSDESSPLNVVPHIPAHRELSGFEQVGTVGEALPAPLTVLVMDKFGNPVPDAYVEVDRLDEDAGSISATGSTTDLDGRVTMHWTLGTVAGEHTGSIWIETIGQASFQATARPGPPDSITTTGASQAAPARTTLPEPLVVDIRDRYGNALEGLPVEWELTAGDATVDSAETATDSLGHARAWVTAGETAGETFVVAQVDTLPEQEFRVVTGDPMNLTVDAVYLTQSTQTYDGSVPLVAGRDGYLRVFALADTANAAETSVRVDLYESGTLLDTRIIPAPSSSVPTEPDRGVLASTWNMEVPGELIVPGLEVLVEVDPDDGVFERDEDDNTFPASGTPLAMDVRSPPPFEVRLVPVYIPDYGTTGDVDGSNADDYLVDAERMYPINGYDADVHAPMTTTATSTTTRDDWETILSEVAMLRASEGSSRYYYGVIANSGGSPYCGLGYRPGYAAVGLDECGAGTAAHEWGHNFNRAHSPCGGPDGVDPGYPYSDGSIGVDGLDVPPLEPKSPEDYADLMSYCGPRWISDYTYTGVLEHLESEAAASPMAYAQAEPTVLVWGRVGPDGLTLEPTIRIDTRPTLPAAPGSYTIAGEDDAGAALFELSFDPVPVADAPDGTGHFAFAVPLSPAEAERLARVRLDSPDGRRVEHARGPARAAAAPPSAVVERLDGERHRVEWDPAAYPLLLVKSARTGEVLGFGRDGSAVLSAEPGDVDLYFADGLHTARGRATLPRQGSGPRMQ
ncbi:MAG: Ig-like domain-containing protein [Gemmatimonadota bacterium]